MNKLMLFCAGILLCLNSAAQQAPAFPVTDSQPALVNGLELGYTIKSTEVKAVGDKGNFSRYSVSFYVRNTSPEAKIILYKQGLNLLGNVSDQLAQFNCLNATGARFTSKTATISATACNVLALVDDKDCNSKTTQSKRFVQIGYWIQAGQTISANCILITPLNEPPNIQAIYLASSLQPAANTIVSDGPNYPPPPPAGIQSYGPGIVKIRNVQNGTYINNQGGPVVQSEIDKAWWSAQWVLVPIPNTNQYNIQNRWKKTYLTIDKGGIDLFVNYMSDGARWVLENCRDGNVLIKNVAAGGYLCIGSNQIELTKNYNLATVEWSLEQP